MEKDLNSIANEAAKKMADLRTKAHIAACCYLVKDANLVCWPEPEIDTETCDGMVAIAVTLYLPIDAVEAIDPATHPW